MYKIFKEIGWIKDNKMKIKLAKLLDLVYTHYGSEEIFFFSEKW